jgi:hypothetical protein
MRVREKIGRDEATEDGDMAEGAVEEALAVEIAGLNAIGVLLPLRRVRKPTSQSNLLDGAETALQESTTSSYSFQEPTQGTK